MKLKSVVLTGLLSLFFIKSAAQRNFLPGKLIMPNQDTLTGYIDYGDRRETPNKITFALNPDGKGKKYSPSEVLGFMVKDEVYRSAVVDTEGSPYNLSNLEENSEFKIISNQNVFLLLLIGGPKSLLLHADRNGKEHFYIQDDSGYSLLLHKKYLAPSGVKEKLNYKAQLHSYLNDCSGIIQEIAAFKYSRKALMNLFMEYYGCVDQEKPYKHTFPNAKVRFGVLGGLTLTAVSFGSGIYDYVAYADYSISTKPAGGLYLDIIFPRNKKRWSLRNDLTYVSFLLNGRYEDIKSENIHYYYISKIGLSYLKISSLLTYSQPVRRISVFARVGVSYGFGRNETTYLRLESKVFSNETTTIRRLPYPLKHYEAGLVASIGLSYKRFSLEVRGESTDGISDYMPTYPNRVYFLVGFQL